MTYELIERLPTPQEHHALFEAVGWQPYTPEETAAALANTLYGVVAMRDGQPIGMARVIGDRGKFYYIQDFAVRPEHQGQGVGGAMLERLLAFIRAAAPGDAFVGLFATPTAIPFYRQYGFEPHSDMLAGMWTVLHRTA
ncbi:MAG: GNAT family N-acetyltransferase [Anaerolineae bacterium]|nr:GNAT family N-acetyltransferase [Anaerolineae bacterium]